MNRKYWIDLLRGFAIILIVLGHFYQGFLFTQYIYIFHVPLFFVISGMCYNTQDISFRKFIIYKIKALIIPYLCFGIVIIPMAYWLDGAYTIFGGIQVLIWYLVQRRFTTMWFLTTLFCTEVIFKAIHNYANKFRNSKIVVLCISLVVSSLFIIYEYVVNIELPWNFDLAMVCLLFYSMGYLLKDFENNYKKEYIKTGILMFALGMLLGSVSINISSRRLDIFYGELGMPMIGVLGALFACIGLVLVFSRFPHIYGLEKIGCHTMTIFALHQMVFKQLFLKILHFDGWMMILVACCITISICFFIDVFISNSSLKWIIGKH